MDLIDEEPPHWAKKFYPHLELESEREGAQICFMYELRYYLAARTFITAWNTLFECAYNTSKYPRPSIFGEEPFCYRNDTITTEMDIAVSSLGNFHRYRLEYALKWDPEEYITYTCFCYSKVVGITPRQCCAGPFWVMMHVTVFLVTEITTIASKSVKPDFLYHNSYQ
jgi:hypothetical protein